MKKKTPGLPEIRSPGEQWAAIFNPRPLNFFNNAIHAV